MIGVVADAEFVANNRRDALSGPDLADEAERFGASG
jgi:hypothetical protein